MIWTIPIESGAAFMQPEQRGEIGAIGDCGIGLLAAMEVADSCRQRESRNALFKVASTQTLLRGKALVYSILRVFLGFPAIDVLWIQSKRQ